MVAQAVGCIYFNVKVQLSRRILLMTDREPELEVLEARSMRFRRKVSSTTTKIWFWDNSETSKKMSIFIGGGSSPAGLMACVRQNFKSSFSTSKSSVTKLNCGNVELVTDSTWHLSSMDVPICLLFCWCCCLWHVNLSTTVVWTVHVRYDVHLSDQNVPVQWPEQPWYKNSGRRQVSKWVRRGLGAMCERYR